MNYAIEILQRELDEELQWLSPSVQTIKLSQGNLIEKADLAIERIPQLQKAIEILKQKV